MLNFVASRQSLTSQNAATRSTALRTEPTMRKWRVLGLVSITLPTLCKAQTVTCNDGSSGYDSLAGLQNDIDEQVQQINAGQTPPELAVYNLCPGSRFQMDTSLRPQLQGSVYRCGPNGRSSNDCQFTGGTSQVQIQPTDIVQQGYQLTDVQFQGITFTGFTQSAISGNADSDVTVKLSNAIFRVSAMKFSRCNIFPVSSISLHSPFFLPFRTLTLVLYYNKQINKVSSRSGSNFPKASLRTLVEER
jgi:hypothetical protein